jgi:WD40 repeat protein
LLGFITGLRLVTSDEKHFRVWDVAADREVFSTPDLLALWGVYPSSGLAVLIEPSADSRTESLVLWDLRANRRAGRIEALPRVRRHIDVAPDGRQIALLDLTTAKVEVQIWDVPTARFINRLSAPDLWNAGDGLTRCAFSPCGRLLLASGTRGGVSVHVLWEVETGRQQALPELSLAYWVGDGPRLHGDGPSRTGRPDKGGHTFSTRNNKRHSFARTGYLQIWGATPPVPTYALDSPVQSLSFNRDASQVAVNEIVWDMRKSVGGLVLRRAAISHETLFPVFTDKDELWAAVLRDEAILFRLAPDPIKVTLPKPRYPDLDGAGNRAGKKEGLSAVPEPFAVAFGPDGRSTLLAVRLMFKSPPVSERPGEIALGGTFSDGTKGLELWDCHKAERVALMGYEDWACLQFSPDGKQFAAGCDKGIKLWDVAGARLQRTLSDDPTVQIVFSPDGKRLLALHAGTRATLFDVASGGRIQTWDVDKAAWKSLAMAPNQAWLATGGEDGMVRLWDITTGAELARWQGHTAAVTVLAFHPDGQTLFSGGGDGVLKLWNLPFLRKGLAELGLDW